jgi:hypothetical protein
MTEDKYSITVNYRLDTPEREETTNKIFSSLIKRDLVFSARPSECSQDHNAVRVSITHGNVSSFYSPITEGMPRLLEKLVEIKNDYRDQQKRDTTYDPVARSDPDPDGPMVFA